MSLFEGTAPPNIETTRTTAATAPQYLTDYLTNLAQAGQTQLGVPSDQLIAGQSPLQQQAYANAPGQLSAYQPAMQSALSAGQTAAQGIGAQQISNFYNPYQQSVVDEMARQSQQNIQRNLMPQAKAAFAGTGGFGSQRYAGAMGQMLGDVQSDLLGQQAKAMSAGYTTALDAALKNAGLQSQAAGVLGTLGGQQQQAATSGLKMLSDLGAQQQAYEQAKIEAPLARAQNVAQIMRGYTYPTTTTETYKGPANVYGPSPLSQIAGLGSLLGSGFNSPSGWGNQLLGGFKDFLGGLGGISPNLGLGGINPVSGEYIGSLEFAKGGSVNREQGHGN